MRSIHITSLALALVAGAAGIAVDAHQAASPSVAKTNKHFEKTQSKVLQRSFIRSESAGSLAASKVRQTPTCPNVKYFIDYYTNDNGTTFTWCEESCYMACPTGSSCPADHHDSCKGCVLGSMVVTGGNFEASDSTNCHADCGCCDHSHGNYHEGECQDADANDGYGGKYAHKCGSVPLRNYVFMQKSDDEPTAAPTEDPHGSACNPHSKAYSGGACFTICIGSYPEGLDMIGFEQGSCLDDAEAANREYVGFMDMTYWFDNNYEEWKNSYVQNALHICDNPTDNVLLELQKLGHPTFGEELDRPTASPH